MLHFTLTSHLYPAPPEARRPNATHGSFVHCQNSIRIAAISNDGRRNGMERFGEEMRVDEGPKVKEET